MILNIGVWARMILRISEFIYDWMLSDTHMKDFNILCVCVCILHFGYSHNPVFLACCYCSELL